MWASGFHSSLGLAFRFGFKFGVSVLVFIRVWGYRSGLDSTLGLAFWFGFDFGINVRVWIQGWD